MFLNLKSNNFVLQQPTGLFFSYVLNGERMLLEVNDTAAEILLCLDGTLNIDDIINIMSMKYGEAPSEVAKYIKPFIGDLKDNLLIEENKNKSKYEVFKGSLDYYTPDFVTLDVTHKCPLKCAHCFVNAGIGKSMDNNICLDVVKELLELGVTTFQITGGEPFVYSNIKNVLDILIKKNVSIRIATSGYVHNKLSEECLDMLFGYKDIHVQVSIDGTEEIHNQIRGKKDSFSKAMLFISKCIDKNIPVTVATSLINQPILKLSELTGILKDKGISQQRFGLITNQGRAKENDIARYSYKDFLEILCKLKENYEDDFFSIEEIENKQEANFDCGAGYKTIKIMPNLLVTPCALMSFNIGNLSTESLVSMFKRTTRVFMPLNHPEKSICGVCLHQEYCNGCISEAIVRKETVKNCNWYEKERALIESV